jgi:hypothetical protein
MPHDHMIFSVEECENATLIPGKNTAIIATSQGPIRLLMLTLFSLLLRSNQKNLEHIMVCINGADTRCGDPSLQNEKQRFLEDLRELKWFGRDMPLTVIRAWSRVGHAHSLEMAIPWVHTEYYTIMHDDIIILGKDWFEEAYEIFKDSKVAMVNPDPVTYGDCSKFTFEEKLKFIRNVHANSTFAVCKKSIMTKLGARWYGYHIVKDYSMRDVNYEKYVEYNKQYKDNDDSFPKENDDYEGLSLDIGSWVIHEIKENGYSIKTFSAGKIFHFVGASWAGDERYVEDREKQHKSLFESIEKEIDGHPEFAKLYRKYNPTKEAKEIHATLL